MKKITILAVAALAISFASCRKERVCECVTTSDAPGSVSSTTKYTYSKAKKGICKDMSQSSIAVAPVAGTYTSKTECTLK